MLIAARCSSRGALAAGGRVADRRAVLLALLGGAFFALDIALFNTAVLRTSVATATLLANNAPIFVGLATWFVFRKRPPRLVLDRTGAGAGRVRADRRCRRVPDRPSGATDITGDLLALTCAVFWAAYMLTAEHVRAHMDTLTFSTLAIVGSVLTMLVVCLVLGVPLSRLLGPDVGLAFRPRPRLTAWPRTSRSSTRSGICRPR